MQLIYEGTDITDYIVIRKCIHTDVSGGRCDCLDIELENAERWLRWGPKQDDTLEVKVNGYTTGKMYLNTVLPEDDHFRIIATSLKSAAKRKAWQSFSNAKIKDIFSACSAQCGMEWRAYGIDENAVYPYIERKNEGCAAFLDRITHLEGATLKCVCGRFAGIGIEYAQGLNAVHRIQIGENQRGTEYSRRDALKYSAITIKTPYAEATAIDESAHWQERQVYTELPAGGNVQAGRWARGLLLTNNRTAERFTLRSDFNAGMTALARVDIESAADVAGEWVVDAATHDLFNMRTTVEMLRTVTTIR